MSESPTRGRRADGAQRSLHPDITMLAVMAAVLVTAHFTLRATQDEVVLGRVGNVVEVPPDDRTATTREEDLRKLEPTLIMVGGSQQSRFAASRPRTEPKRRAGGDMILDGFAREMARRHPGRDLGTFVRVSQGNFHPIDQLAAVGVLLERAKWPPMVMVLAIDPFDSTTEVTRDIPEVFARHPEAAAAFFARLASVPGGADVVQRFTQALAVVHAPFEPTGMGFEAELSKALAKRRYYYGTRFGTPVKPLRIYTELEAPLLQRLFGRVQQPPPERYLPPPEQVPRFAEKQGNFRFYETFVRYLTSVGITPVCFAAPWNPNVLAPSPATDKVVAKLRATVSQAGCTFIDASRAVSAAEENWGWEWAVPDDAHLMPPGIDALGIALATKGEEVGAWSAVLRANEPDRPAVP